MSRNRGEETRSSRLPRSPSTFRPHPVQTRPATCELEYPPGHPYPSVEADMGKRCPQKRTLHVTQDYVGDELGSKENQPGREEQVRSNKKGEVSSAPVEGCGWLV
ncbi:unnamed protein product [Rangifer tarandus platyrhynchus]|uniref:Uncharacterized protein n=1 Tax=Rangifer tarandus platyrhynchus TaxID=3082113 RepID=A0AC59Z314_RANTA